MNKWHDGAHTWEVCGCLVQESTRDFPSKNNARWCVSTYGGGMDKNVECVCGLEKKKGG